MMDLINPDLVLRNALGQEPGSPSYSCFANAAYAGYATPSDMFSIRGVAGKLIQIRFMTFLSQSTAAALVNYYWYKRAALNTGGAPSTATLVSAKADSADPAPAAQPRLYTAAPVIVDAAAPLLSLTRGLTSALTSSPAQLSLAQSGLSLIANVNIDIAKPLCVRENEELVLNFGGAALPAGFSVIPGIQWIEMDLDE